MMTRPTCWMRYTVTASPLPAPLVGRERELAVLRAHLARALARQGSLVLLSGEAGVGKTALAESLCHEAQDRGARLLVGRGYDLSETPPYGPWTEACAQLLPAPGSPQGSMPPVPDARQTAVQ